MLPHIKCLWILKSVWTATGNANIYFNQWLSDWDPDVKTQQPDYKRRKHHCSLVLYCCENQCDQFWETGRAGVCVCACVCRGVKAAGGSEEMFRGWCDWDVATQRRGWGGLREGHTHYHQAYSRLLNTTQQQCPVFLTAPINNPLIGLDWDFRKKKRWRCLLRLQPSK